jgi:hypothetical protein
LTVLLLAVSTYLLLCGGWRCLFVCHCMEFWSLVPLYGLDDKALNLMLVGNISYRSWIDEHNLYFYFCSLLFLLATYLSIWTIPLTIIICLKFVEWYANYPGHLSHLPSWTRNCFLGDVTLLSSLTIPSKNEKSSTMCLKKLWSLPISHEELMSCN